MREKIFWGIIVGAAAFWFLSPPEKAVSAVHEVECTNMVDIDGVESKLDDVITKLDDIETAVGNIGDK